MFRLKDFWRCFDRHSSGGRVGDSRRWPVFTQVCECTEQLKRTRSSVFKRRCDTPTRLHSPGANRAKKCIFPFMTAWQQKTEMKQQSEDGLGLLGNTWRRRSRWQVRPGPRLRHKTFDACATWSWTGSTKIYPAASGFNRKAFISQRVCGPWKFLIGKRGLTASKQILWGMQIMFEGSRRCSSSENGKRV